MCGARGSTPTPGVAFARYGGHTSCVALAHDGEPPSVVLDAGTGIRAIGELLGGEPFHGTVLVSHLHWDHVQGLPFFGAGDCEGAEVDVPIPEQGDALEVMSRVMSPPHFPISPTALRGRWNFAGLEEGVRTIGGFEVLAREIPHKGGRTYGFRVSDKSGAVAYLSDHAPALLGGGPDGWGPYHPAAIDLARGVDVLFHDAQCTAAELPSRLYLGHSAADYGVELARRAGARRVLLFHHDPARTDVEVDAMVASFASDAVEVGAAREGMVVDVAAAPVSRRP